MRFRTVVAAVVLCLVTLPAIAQQSGVEQIPLKHLDPREAAEQLSRALPEGVTQVKPYDLTNSLLVAGTEAGIAALKQMVSALDIPPISVRVVAELYAVTPPTFTTDAIGAISDRRRQGVIEGLSAERVAEALKGLRKQGGGVTVMSPRVTTYSGRMAAIAIQQGTPQGPALSLRVHPRVAGKVVQADVVIVEGCRDGITYSGRMAAEVVTVPVGEPIALWLAPTKEAPNDLVVVLRFEVLEPERQPVVLR